MKKHKNFYILIDGEVLKSAEEWESYEYKYADEFDNESYFLKWAKCLTEKLDKLENVGNNNFEVFSEFGGLPEYSYGESHYWSSNEWSHLDRPKDLIDVLAHFRRLFPTSNVKVIEELVTIQTHKSATVLDW